MYVGSACTLCLAVQALIWESSHILREAAYLKAAEYPMHFALAAVAGFGVNALAILVIKLASSLTLKVRWTMQLHLCVSSCCAMMVNGDVPCDIGI